MLLPDILRSWRYPVSRQLRRYVECTRWHTSATVGPGVWESASVGDNVERPSQLLLPAQWGRGTEHKEQSWLRLQFSQRYRYNMSICLSEHPSVYMGLVYLLPCSMIDSDGPSQHLLHCSYRYGVLLECWGADGVFNTEWFVTRCQSPRGAAEWISGECDTWRWLCHSHCCYCSPVIKMLSCLLTGAAERQTAHCVLLIWVLRRQQWCRLCTRWQQ